MKLMFHDVQIEKEKILFDQNDQCYGEVSYIFHMNGSSICASREIFSEDRISNKVYFGRFKHNPSILVRFSLFIRKIIYNLKLHLSRDEVMFNLYNGTEPNEFIVLPAIPYDNELFKKAIEYFFKKERISDICILTSSAAKGYEQVNVDKIMKK